MPVVTSGPWARVVRHPWLRDNETAGIFAFEGIVKYVPLVMGGGLFAFTILVAAIGPIDWRFDNAREVYGFLIACFLALVAGYVVSVRRRPRPRGTAGPVIPASTLVIAGAVLYLLLYPLAVYEATGKWYPDIYRGLAHSGQAYAAKTYAQEHLSQYATYLGMLVAPLTIGVIPLTLFFFRRLSRPARALGLLVIALSLALGVAQAINQDVGEICGYVVVFLVIVAATARGSRRERWTRVARCGVAAILTCCVFLGYYSLVIHNRVATDVADQGTETGQSTDEAMAADALHNFGRLRNDSIFYQTVPTAVQGRGLMLSSYLTQGYKGLSLAMDSPWHPTWGLGFSIFVRHNASRVLGLDENGVEARTYEGEIDARGWPAGAQWSTFFIHPASDITFPGVVLLMGVIGFGFGLSWRDVCIGRDPLACVVFFYFLLLLFYLSANNQLYQQGRLAIGFSVVLVAWLALRSRGARQPDPVPAAGPANASRS